MCKVSVVTSVYNCEEYIAETIQSVINQTFTDWEFIIINDCSKDKSAEIIKSFKDDRIRFYDNDSNQGQCKNLNKGILLAKGEYIARLDHDDICYPDRLKEQVEYMDKHPEVVLCGSWLDTWENGVVSKKECPEVKGFDELAFSLYFGSYYLPHSSFMIRKKAMIDNNIWYGDYLYAEDYDLLHKMLKVGKIAFIPKSLIIYRIFPEQATQTYSKELIGNERDEIRCSNIDETDFQYKDILKRALLRNLRTWKDYQQFSKGFLAFTQYCGLNYNKRELRESECLKTVFYDMCIIQQYSWGMLINYVTSPFKRTNWLFSRQGIEFAIKCMIHYHH